MTGTMHYLGRKEIADYFGVGERTVDQWIQRRLLPPGRSLSGRPVWERRVIEVWGHLTGRRPMPDPAGEAAAELRAADQPVPGAVALDGYYRVDVRSRAAVLRLRKNGYRVRLWIDRARDRQPMVEILGISEPTCPAAAGLPDPLALLAVLDSGDPVPMDRLVWAVDEAYDVVPRLTQDDLDSDTEVPGGDFVGVRGAAGVVAGWIPLLARACGCTFRVGPESRPGLYTVRPSDPPDTYDARTGYGIGAERYVITKLGGTS